MSFFSRGLFVVAGIIAGSTAINYFVLGNTADYGLPSSRLGAWREAKVRPACFFATESPEKDPARPQLPYGQHRIAPQDYRRMVEMTAALHCYLVTKHNAVCEPNNRAYIVDYIGKYFDKMDSMLEAGARYGKDEVQNVKMLWDGQNNREINAALQEHVRAGHLIKSDFGWSSPAPMKALFEEYSDVQDSCPKEAPGVAQQ
jgi:hypothetical protein